MAKDERKQLSKKLAKAQLKLRAADEDVAATRVEGEQAVQRARLKAERELAGARRELARRVEKVARLEREISGDESPNGAVATPDQAANVIERIEEVSDPLDQPTLIIPN